MASNQPGKCCFEGVCHDGTPKGRREEIFGLDTYAAAGSTSPKEKVIVILTDVYGNKFNNVLLMAEKSASAGYMVFSVPDILFGDAISSDKPIDRGAWPSKTFS